MSEKKYVPDGTFTTCDKGAGFSTLGVLPTSSQLYGKLLANENDKITAVNIRPMGLCSITKVVCVPAPLMWMSVKNNVQRDGGRLLQEDSTIQCTIGGKISLSFIMPAGGTDENEELGFWDKLGQQYNDITGNIEKWNEENLGPLGSYLNFQMGVAEGFVKGAVGLVEGVWGLAKFAGRMATDPVGTTVSTAKAAWQAGGAAIDWASKGENWQNLGHSIANASPRDWGNVVGQVGFEIAATAATGGAAQAARAGRLGAAAVRGMEMADKLGDAAKLSRLASGASRVASKVAPRVLGAVTDGAKAVGRAGRQALDKLPQPVKCALRLEPVDMGSGTMLSMLTDVSLPGPIPFEWQRTWYSRSDYNGPMGYGWHHRYDLALRLESESDVAVLRMADGRQTDFAPPVLAGEPVFDRSNRLSLYRPAEAQQPWRVWHHDERVWYVFDVPRPDGPMQPLQRIENRTGQAIQFSYTVAGHLARILDSAGRELTLDTDARGRITALYGPDPEQPSERMLLMAYSYDAEGNMATYTNAEGYQSVMHYKGHLMVKKTSPSGLSFYWEYDGPDHLARCIHSWGDGGLHEGWLSYPDEETTILTTRDGKTTFTHYRGLVTDEVDPLGRHKQWLYNGFDELEVERDGAGNATTYDYDRWGNLTALQHADGATEAWQYDPETGERLLASTNARGGSYTYLYDEAGNLSARTDPMSHATRYQYDGQGRLTSLTNALGQTTHLRYDAQSNLTHIIAPDQTIRSRTYDALGRLVILTDEAGYQQQRTYDRLGQLITVVEPDGSRQTMAYDSMGNVVQATGGGQAVSFTYVGLSQLASRQQGGTRIDFSYDLDERLTGLRNEKGEQYRFVLDRVGQVVEEIGFDGLTRHYQRDAAGRVAQVRRPDGRTTAYAYDGVGRVTGVRYEEGPDSPGLVQTYRYDGMGALLEARTGNSRVVLERDALGRVVAEVQDGERIESIYDALGQRTHLTSSLGADLHVDYDALGQIRQLSSRAGQQAPPWQVGFSYDSRGLEVHRQLSGTSLRWQYDALGRPTEQGITLGRGGVQRQRRYHWQGFDQLARIEDSLLGATTFGYNDQGYLTQARYADGGHDIRQADAVGNLFGTTSQQDRHYGAGGRLLAGADGTRYRYDGEGNLIEKQLPNRQGSWHYRWDSAGQLISIKRPDGYTVQCQYDALGRRTHKLFRGKLTRWVWDGDVPLHEWSHYTLDGQPTSPDELITWLFEDGSFAPLARLTPQVRYSVVTDHLGTPLELVDEGGSVVWGAQLDSYGRVRQGTGKASLCPFRYQGQYEDAETGLYYNRFRYYSPQEGMYISQDPIGLASGEANLYAYASDSNQFIDPYGLSTGAGYDHVTYRGIKNGKPYTGYASAPSTLNLTAEQIVSRRYSGNFDAFGGVAPTPVYHGKGINGKRTARGLEQHYFEEDVAKYGRSRVANKQNPVGPNNVNRNNYLNAKNKHLGINGCP
ncbi:DUF6531 domain-containing protein [Fibrella sp. WM1]|uniref:DUF6531 domain-containing protein n=1 Tax=Fibrella musci TaxID=3242485 RepID=UPI0035223A6D